MTPTITYRKESLCGERVITLPIGRVYEVQRESDCVDICLSRVVATDCPLEVTILIRTNGEITLWDTSWSRSTNTYWHFKAGSDADATNRRPTPEQQTTLERMFLGLADLPGSLDGTLGQPVAAWAFAGSSPGEIAKRHGVKTPPMS
jgi:hypothetical protein